MDRARHQCCHVFRGGLGRPNRPSISLLADVLDMLGDALVYGLSLFARADKLLPW
ncbi:hypothetical protein [Acidithiobacillus ferriphilus]|jgi:hypothetical protein|uniref:hypothetical protein n=1 Tax=Acidithiobacillus ferriphilus TaxID=1689834 RepID=UPI00020D1EBB|nr:hypothetical protein [Acidithiobacillus ferriphilus]